MDLIQTLTISGGIEPVPHTCPPALNRDTSRLSLVGPEEQGMDIARNGL